MNTLTEVHDLVFHGKGGYIWSDVYNMPIYLRRFALSKLKEYYDATNKSNKPQTSPDSSTLVDSTGQVNKKAFNSHSPKYK